MRRLARRGWLRPLSGVALALGFACLPGAAGAQSRPASHPRDASVPSAATIEERVRDLLARMTPEEKFWQLFMLAGEFAGDESRFRDGLFGLQVPADADTAGLVRRMNAIQRHFVEETRLGIPVIFFAEALHGLVQDGATVFPQAIGLAASFDPALVEEVARATTEECRFRGVRQVLSPVVNVATDVRWGRTEETYGEDPFLASEIGVAFVSAFEQGGVITTPKHWIANVGDGGRDSYPIELSERAIREIHLPPFRACIRRGGSRALMAAYNSLDGSPCSAQAWLNDRVLKRELGFTGFVVSDAGGVGGANVLHFTASDYEDATQQAIEGGLDVIFQTSFDHRLLFEPPFLDGRISPARIDDAVSRVLRAKFELGLFDDPYLHPGAIAPPDRRAHRELARRAACASIVLLKNEGGLLPLRDTLRSVAVLGPDADEARLGGYSAPAGRGCTILQGVRERLGTAAVVRHAAGCRRLPPRLLPVPAAALSCDRGDSTAAGLLGEYFDNVTLSGLPQVTRVDPVVDFQWTLFSPDPQRLRNDFYSVRWSGTLRAPVTGRVRIGIEGSDGYRLSLGDSLVLDRWTKASAGIRTAEVDLVVGRSLPIRLEYYEPTGPARLRLVWDVGAVTDEEDSLRAAVDLAAHADAAIIVAGIEEGEFRDRASLALPGRQEELIGRVAALGKPLVVVLVGGSAVTMSRWLDATPAVLDVWYPGEEGGRAVADVLFGDVNPAGRLPITFPIAEGQLPLIYNHKPTGRGDDYLDLSGQPLFPFGHGLSYTRFEYTDLRIEPPQIRAGESATVEFTLRNVGSRAGDGVVQLYLRDELASVAQPVSRLQGFRRVHLEPGERSTVRLPIRPESVSLLDRNLRESIEPGDIRVMVGASSRDIRLRGWLAIRE